MYFSGDFNVLDSAFGIGSLGEGDGPHLEVPKVPSEGQEESDEWVLPERAYDEHEGEEGGPHEQEDEGIPVEVAVPQDAAPEVEESAEGQKEPGPTSNEEDPFADNSADLSAAEVEAQLDVSNEEPVKDDETSETVFETDRGVDEASVDEAPVDEAQEGSQEGSEAAVAEIAEAAIPKLDVSEKDIIEEEEKKD